MKEKKENSNNWEELFLQLGKGGWGKGNNISFSLIKKAGIEPYQYEYLYNKLNEWNTLQNKCDVAVWQIQLLSGKEYYFQEHASKINKSNGNLLFYAVWSGNLHLAKEYYHKNPADFYKEQNGFHIGNFAVCSQNIELLEWIRTIDSSQLKIQTDGYSLASLAAKFGYMKSLQWLCEFDFNLLNTKDMFYLLTCGNIFLPFIKYLHENETIHLLTDYKYLAYFAVQNNCIPLYQWLTHNKPELLNQLIEPTNMNLLQFAAYQGSNKIFSLVFNNQINLIEIKDKNGLGFMEYAFLCGSERVNYALGLSTSDYWFTLNVPKGCEIGYSFGQLNNIYGMSKHMDFEKCVDRALNTNYRIQTINHASTSTEISTRFLSLLLKNRESLEKEAQIATTLWLLLTTGIRSNYSNFPKECLDIIFKNCFIENKKPQNRYLSFFNKLPAFSEKDDEIIDNSKKHQTDKNRCILF